ncbi:MAG: protein phosphatase 2C domain-containing protein [Propionibacteriaceae bacterium]|jgi:protein phosphatase|nr:protein phosphatase 2C domain-containing protein [Propionibacteriaceae bacterium]
MTDLLESVAAVAVSDVGLRRNSNEDSVLADPPVFIVADGMGGHEAGEVASGIVVAELSALAGRLDVQIDDVKERLHTARLRIEEIPTSIPGALAGTTVSGVILTTESGQPYWLGVNLGDSRTYRYWQGELEQLSVDHSEVQELIDAGQLTVAEARLSPRRNIITRALGAGTAENPDYWMRPVTAGERLLICSDGLSSDVADEELAAILRDHPDRGEALAALLAAAMGAGGHDNISIIVLDALPFDGGAESENSTDMEDTAENFLPRRAIWPDEEEI